MTYSKDFLKERYERLAQSIEVADRYTQEITRTAYQNTRLISNQVLSRNPHSNRFFKKLLYGETPQASHGFSVVFRILRGYVSGVRHFSVYVLTYVCERLLSRPVDASLQNPAQPLYVIDTFLFMDRLLEQDGFTDYMGALYPVLQKQKKTFLLLPRLFGKISPSRMRKVRHLLRQKGYPFLTEFQLLTWADLLRVAWFMAIYPLDVLRLASRLPKGDTLDRLFSEELLETIHQVNYHHHIRYWVGRRFGQSFKNKLTLLSWNENQTIDKNLFKGLKETAPGTTIVGCQLFIGYPPLINQRIASSDKIFGMTPDCVLVNGPAYLKPQAPCEYRTGVSLRYQGVFTHSFRAQDQSKTVIFLSYLQDLNREIVALTADCPFLRDQALSVHVHPANQRGDLPPLPPNWQYVDRDRYEMLKESSMMITSESSVAVEAAALETSVIIVASQTSFTCNPMLPLGRGEIWDIAFDSQEIQQMHERLQAFRSQHPERLVELSKAYKAQCFVEPTEENIIQAFRLND